MNTSVWKDIDERIKKIREKIICKRFEIKHLVKMKKMGYHQSKPGMLKACKEFNDFSVDLKKELNRGINKLYITLKHKKRELKHKKRELRRHKLEKKYTYFKYICIKLYKKFFLWFFKYNGNEHN